MKDLISIIVPIFNVERYLDDCLNSIINQTYKNLEIILIDDGSIDSSGIICDKYLEIDKRIKVIHQDNKGLSMARNAGLDIATGEFVAFVDSDDWLELNMYEELHKAICMYQTDIATCGIKEIYHDSVKITNNSCEKYTVRTKKETFRDLYKPSCNIRFEVWNKMFRKTAIIKNRFVEGQIYEDVYFDYITLINITKIVTVQANLYCYRKQRPGNTNTTFQWNRFSIFTELYRYIIFFKKNGWDDLVDDYKIFAAETALSHYIDAYEHNVTHDMLSECRRWSSFYSIGNSKSSFKMKIFNISPILYLLGSRYMKYMKSKRR